MHYLNRLQVEAARLQAVIGSRASSQTEREDAERSLRQVTDMMAAPERLKAAEGHERDARATIDALERSVGETRELVARLEASRETARRAVAEANDRIADQLIAAARDGGKAPSPSDEYARQVHRLDAHEKAVSKAAETLASRERELEAARVALTAARDERLAQAAFCARIDHEDAWHAYATVWLKYRGSYIEAFGTVPAEPSFKSLVSSS